MPIESGNQLDKLTSPQMKHKRTKFPINGKLFNTYRFGEYGIAGCFNGIAGDKVKTRTHSIVDSYTLGAPLMSPIYMNKAWFMVPRMAILPRAWDLIYTNPTIGQDIDAAEYGTSVKANRWKSFLNALLAQQRNYTNSTNFEEGRSLAECTIVNWLNSIIHTITWNEYIFSYGSLINTLGAKFGKLWKTEQYKNFDEYYEAFWKIVVKYITGMYIQDENNNTYTTWIPGNGIDDSIKISKGVPVMPWQMFLSKLRDGDKIIIEWAFDEQGIKISENEVYIDDENFKALLDELDLNMPKYSVEWKKPIDIASLWAYQMSCAEFFTNDKVDYIYNAQLFRDYIQNLYFTITDDTVVPYYTINGNKIQVDALSARIFQTIITYLEGSTYITAYEEEPEIYFSFNAYLSALFSYKRSLRYKDYFTGARTRPLAIGDTDIPVQAGNYVDVVDVSKNIQKQRFLNVVNKIPRTLKGYTKAIAGVDVAPDWHNPLFIGMTKSVIYGTETENTGEAQMTEKVSRTTTLTGEGKYQFEFNLDRNCIIIGVTYFDIERAYSQGVRRSFFEVDRYDMFNPYLQYTGDQPIYKEEYNCEETGTFGYTGAYMHMKQAVTEAAGGFITALKGWTFLDQYESDGDLEPDHIGPDFIRSRPYELDKFYLSLSGTSLANYFHFIIEEDIIYDASRTMAYNPQIIF